MTAPTPPSWRVRTASGQEFVWQGDPDAAFATASAAGLDGIGCPFLACVGGTLVNLALVESLTPIDAL